MNNLTPEDRKAINDPRTCPHCGARGHRVQTRPEVNGLHRRRECINKECRWRWTTVEIDADRAQHVARLERAFQHAYEALADGTSGMTYGTKQETHDDDSV